MRRILLAPLVALALMLQPLSAVAAGGPSNVVIATNQTDGRIVVQGRVQISRVDGMVAAPLNYAMAQSTTCTGCKTLSVALQLDFAKIGTPYVAPQNVAVATNGSCTGCTTIAKAVQVFYMVDDPTQLPPALQQDIVALDQQLIAISSDPTISMTDAEARVDAVIAQFVATASMYSSQRQMAAN